MSLKYCYIMIPDALHANTALSPSTKSGIIGFKKSPSEPMAQGVPPGLEHLNIARIKLHSSMTFI
jgi:hypothetical protein